jgi:TrpR-related protein YerC/YecD
MDWNNKENKALVQALLALRDASEARRFLRDLMTENEIAEFARRFKAAEMLSENIPYSQIESATGLSSTTVARVSKWLNGKEGGYRAIIARLHHHSPALSRED